MNAVIESERKPERTDVADCINGVRFQPFSCAGVRLTFLADLCGSFLPVAHAPPTPTTRVALFSPLCGGLGLQGTKKGYTLLSCSFLPHLPCSTPRPTPCSVPRSSSVFRSPCPVPFLTVPCPAPPRPVFRALPRPMFHAPLRSVFPSPPTQCYFPHSVYPVSPFPCDHHRAPFVVPLSAPPRLFFSPNPPCVTCSVPL